jgi:hypothetical protein
MLGTGSLTRELLPLPGAPKHSGRPFGRPLPFRLASIPGLAEFDHADSQDAGGRGAAPGGF